VDVVAEGRGMDKARVDSLGKGQVWLGSEAVANGLIDAIGGLDDAKAAMEKRLGARARWVECFPGDPSGGMFSVDMRAALSAALGFDAVPEVLTAALRMAKDVYSMGGGPLYLEPACLMGVR
jgi:ClpP class serine protease